MKPNNLLTKRLATQTLAALGVTILSAGLFAQPTVSYTVTGTPGDYTLDFTVDNTTTAYDTYALGVLVDGSISGIPAGYIDYGTFSVFDTLGVGADVTYNAVWIDPSESLMPPGTSLSGFTTTDTDATAPASVPYFLVGLGETPYDGPDNLNVNQPDNPVFEGNAVSASAVPDSGTTFSLLGLSLGAMGGLCRRFRKA